MIDKTKTVFILIFIIALCTLPAAMRIEEPSLAKAVLIIAPLICGGLASAKIIKEDSSYMDGFRWLIMRIGIFLILFIAIIIYTVPPTSRQEAFVIGEMLYLIGIGTMGTPFLAE